jgi:Mg/Co/Ni transporter MgtE
MDIVSLLVQCLSGAAGGNIAGAVNKAKSLGPMWNTSFGLLGGVLGGQLLGNSLAGMMGNAMAGNVTASALVGFILPFVGGMLKTKPA